MSVLLNKLRSLSCLSLVTRSKRTLRGDLSQDTFAGPLLPPFSSSRRWDPLISIRKSYSIAVVLYKAFRPTSTRWTMYRGRDVTARMWSFWE